MLGVEKDYKKILEESPFFNHMGFEVVEYSEDNMKIKLDISPKLLNANGTLHGGVHASMLDLVIGGFIMIRAKSPIATINFNVNYLKSLKQGVIFADATIIHEGYRTAIAEGTVYTEDGSIVAKANGVFKIFR